MDVADRIGETPVVGDKPQSRVVIQKVTIRRGRVAPAFAFALARVAPAGAGR